MTNKEKAWCFWQSPCSDFKGFACLASSASGFVHECTFSKDGNFINKGMLNGKPRRSPIHPVGGGVCEDFSDPE